MADLKILSKRLIEVRKSNGYTRKRLAEELNRPYRTITNYETGEHEPGHKYLIEIAEKFAVTTDYLLGLSDDPHKTSDEAKKSPSTAEAAPGEDHISLEESNRLLVALGLIEEGQDLSNDDLAFLEHIIGLLDAWFGKRK
ncbi:MAG: helix-turn-helix domain-containing protein [Oscillospiraceae bacterium]|nr:helix-turn-helix domain-containing protein [Oscillospiraceae bacterium]